MERLPSAVGSGRPASVGPLSPAEPSWLRTYLRKQLAMFQERNNKPHRAQDSARWLMARLSRLLIGGALVVVRPDTLIRWHRRGFRLFWRWKSMATGMTTFRRGPFVKAAISAAEPPRLWPNRLTSLTRCSALEWC